jgi:hypothetical protein
MMRDEDVSEAASYGLATEPTKATNPTYVRIGDKSNWDTKQNCGVNAAVFCNAIPEAKALSNRIAKTVGSLDPDNNAHKKILRKVGRCITRAQNDLLVPPTQRPQTEYMKFSKHWRYWLTNELQTLNRGRKPTGAQVAVAMGKLWKLKNPNYKQKTYSVEQQIQMRENNRARAASRKADIKRARTALRTHNQFSNKPYQYDFSRMSQQMGEKRFRATESEQKGPTYPTSIPALPTYPTFDAYDNMQL